MYKKKSIFNASFFIFLFLVVLFIIFSIPLREELSLLFGSELLTPFATKMTIDRRHAREAYLQTLGPDMKYAAYYSTNHYN